MSNTSDFIEKAKKIHKKYDYSKVEYLNSSTKVTIICITHGVFYKSPNNHLRGQGCPECKKDAHGLTSNTSDFIEKAKKIHKKYDYSKVEYSHSRRNVVITCETHGDFTQTPNNHLNGQGCPECKKTTISNKNTLKNSKLFFSKLKDSSDYSYTDTKFVNFTTPIKIKCRKHGVFEILPNNHLRGQGCPECKKDVPRCSSKNELIIAKLIHGSVLNTRVIINPLELDIYSEEHKFAIEYNGLMWHSFGKSKYSMFNNHMFESRDKNKHLRKTELCEEKGIHLFHIFENEWNDLIKKDIWTSIIYHKLNQNRIISKFKTKIISKESAKKFLMLNHLEGYLESKIHIGIFENTNLIGVVVHNHYFGRYSSKNFIHIDFEEILKKFRNITFDLNRRWNMCEQRDDIIPPSKWIFKDKLFKKVPDNFVSSDDYRVIYDCGYFKKSII